jgi:hypothetical protein
VPETGQLDELVGIAHLPGALSVAAGELDWNGVVGVAVDKPAPSVAAGRDAAGRCRSLPGMDDERAARAERRLELPVLVAALLVVPVIVIEESRFGEPWDTIGVVLNWASWLMFLAEAVVMLSVVRDRRTWLRQHPIEVAVVVLTPPFLAALAPVRLLRLLRLLRLVRLARLAHRLFSAEASATRPSSPRLRPSLAAPPTPSWRRASPRPRACTGR